MKYRKRIATKQLKVLKWKGKFEICGVENECEKECEKVVKKRDRWMQ
jgi:K+/H+ antiporter YhaU regulatory subunit KhtT